MRMLSRNSTALALLAVCLLIAGLQMARIRVGALTAQGADIACPALLYIMMRRNKTLLRRIRSERPSPELAAGALLAACYGWEFCQRYNFEGTPLVITRGTFDVLDLAAYTAGIGVPYLIDKLGRSSSIRTVFDPAVVTPTTDCR
jgi:hypothetical protein